MNHDAPNTKREETTRGTKEAAEELSIEELEVVAGGVYIPHLPPPPPPEG